MRKDDGINSKVSSNQYYQAKINDIKNDRNDLNIFTFELESGSTELKNIFLKKVEKEEDFLLSIKLNII